MTGDLEQTQQLLAEIDAVYRRPHHKLTASDETEDIYAPAFESIADAWSQFATSWTMSSARVQPTFTSPNENCS